MTGSVISNLPSCLLHLSSEDETKKANVEKYDRFTCHLSNTLNLQSVLKIVPEEAWIPKQVISTASQESELLEIEYQIFDSYGSLATYQQTLPAVTEASESKVGALLQDAIRSNWNQGFAILQSGDTLAAFDPTYSNKKIFRNSVPEAFTFVRPLDAAGTTESLVFAMPQWGDDYKDGAWLDANMVKDQHANPSGGFFCSVSFVAGAPITTMTWTFTRDTGTTAQAPHSVVLDFSNNPTMADKLGLKTATHTGGQVEPRWDEEENQLIIFFDGNNATNTSVSLQSVIADNTIGLRFIQTPSSEAQLGLLFPGLTTVDTVISEIQSSVTNRVNPTRWGKLSDFGNGTTTSVATPTDFSVKPEGGAHLFIVNTSQNEHATVSAADLSPQSLDYIMMTIDCPTNAAYSLENRPKTVWIYGSNDGNNWTPVSALDTTSYWKTSYTATDQTVTYGTQTVTYERGGLHTLHIPCNPNNDSYIYWKAEMKENFLSNPTPQFRHYPAALSHSAFATTVKYSAGDPVTNLIDVNAIGGACTFVDSGGDTNNYGASENYSYEFFVPPGDSLAIFIDDGFVLEGTAFSIYDTLKLQVWNGTQYNDFPEPWLNKYSTKPSVFPPDISSAVASGAVVLDGRIVMLLTDRVKFEFNSDSNQQRAGWKIGIISNKHSQDIGQHAYITDFQGVKAVSTLTFHSATNNATQLVKAGVDLTNDYITPASALDFNSGTITAYTPVQYKPAFIKVHSSELARLNHINTRGQVDDVIFVCPYDVGGSADHAYKRHDDVMFSHVEYASTLNISTLTIRLTDEYDNPVFLPKSAIMHMFLRVFYVQG